MKRNMSCFGETASSKDRYEVELRVLIEDLTEEQKDKLFKAWGEFEKVIDTLDAEKEEPERTFGDWILFKSKLSAKWIIDKANSIIEEYGSITIAEFYDICKLEHEISDYRRGWKKAIPLQIKKQPNCDVDCYYLVLPEPIFFKEEK